MSCASEEDLLLVGREEVDEVVGGPVEAGVRFFGGIVCVRRSIGVFGGVCGGCLGGVSYCWCWSCRGQMVVSGLRVGGASVRKSACLPADAVIHPAIPR